MQVYMHRVDVRTNTYTKSTSHKSMTDYVSASIMFTDTSTIIERMRDVGQNWWEYIHISNESQQTHARVNAAC